MNAAHKQAMLNRRIRRLTKRVNDPKNPLNPNQIKWLENNKK